MRLKFRIKDKNGKKNSRLFMSVRKKEKKNLHIPGIGDEQGKERKKVDFSDSKGILSIPGGGQNARSIILFDKN